ncbi:hypothetical protein SAMN04489718_4022 [Actinopolyspora saharensis]|uniref:Uncharacterized protein n=1 Tax=Actinopolyspora saharensis TaxID=995062 RepID=A0A1H1H1J4_9ACTN|nr:hypothetical protein SAMN04489718_4022 [Actinopolyspora saharensis]
MTRTPRAGAVRRGPAEPAPERATGSTGPLLRLVVTRDGSRQGSNDGSSEGQSRESAIGVSGRGAQSLACSAAFSSTFPPVRVTASTAPVLELRRNSRPSLPESSAALTRVPSSRVTLVPAVR